MDDLLSDLQVPTSSDNGMPGFAMDNVDDSSLIDDLTFAELFTQDAIFAEHEKSVVGQQKPATLMEEASDSQADMLAASIFDHQTTAPATPPPPASPPSAHRRAPSPSSGRAGPAFTATAVAAAASQVLLPKNADASKKSPVLPGQGQMESPEWDGVIPETFHELEEEMISLIPYRVLAKLMAKSRLTDKEIAQAKKLRRRVKNRQSARVCSTRKRVTNKATEFTNAELHESIATLTEQNQTLMGQHVQLQQQVIAFQKSQQEAIRQKFAMEAELQRLQKAIQDAQKGNVVAGLNQGGAPIHFPEVESLFAIAA